MMSCSPKEKSELAGGSVFADAAGQGDCMEPPVINVIDRIEEIVIS